MMWLWCTQDDAIQSLELQISAKQAEQDSIQERLDSTDAMVGEQLTIMFSLLWAMEYVSVLFSSS